MNQYPKVLVGCITAQIKDYCQPRFLEQLKLLTYPNKEIYFVDNSSTNDNYKKIVKAGFNATWLKRKNKRTLKVMAESHDILRQHALRNGYDYLFHFETDVFLRGNYNIIELLMHQRKQVVSAVYDMGIGSLRQLCVLLIDNLADHVMPYPVKKADSIFMDGKLHRVFNAGIGACLIQSSVLEKITFREEENNAFMPDMNFARDIYDKGINFYADTSLYLEHDNQDWGVWGEDYK